MASECLKELISGHVSYNLQVDIASGTTREEANVTFLCLAAILYNQMTTEIDPRGLVLLHYCQA